MKLRYLKTFENFSDADDMGRFTRHDSDEQEWIDHASEERREEEEEECCSICNGEGCPDCEECCAVCNGEGCPDCEHEEMEEEEEITPENGFRRKVWGDEVIEKKKEKEEEKEEKKEKSKGLTAKQKKLPEGLRKAIEKRKKK